MRYLVSAFLVGTIPLGAIDAQRITPPTDTTRSPATLFTRRDAVLAASFAGITVAMFPIDRSIARGLTNERSHANTFFNRSATGVEVIADPGSLVIGSALYLYGRYAHHPDIADLGWHGTEAVILGGSITAILKGLTGRARPYVSADTNPHDFKFGHGFSGSRRASFPSGHTTAAFAAASAVTSESERIWPHHTWLVGSVMYGGATMVGLSRLYHDKHWASDVALGAAIGTFSGLKVVRYAHAHPDNFIDRAVLGLSATTGLYGPRAILTISLSP